MYSHGYLREPIFKASVIKRTRFLLNSFAIISTVVITLLNIMW